MLWFFLAVFIVILVGVVNRDSYEVAPLVGIAIIATFFAAFMLNLWLSNTGTERVKVADCNLAPLAPNGAYIALVKEDIAYRCVGNNDVVPAISDTYKDPIIKSGPAHYSMWENKKNSRLFSVFTFAEDSQRAYFTVPNGVAAVTLDNGGPK